MKKVKKEDPMKKVIDALQIAIRTYWEDNNDCGNGIQIAGGECELCKHHVVCSAEKTIRQYLEGK